MEQLDDLLAGVDVTLSDEVLDRIDAIVPPGTDVGTLDQAYQPPAIEHPPRRRRPLPDTSPLPPRPSPARPGPPGPPGTRPRSRTTSKGLLVGRQAPPLSCKHVFGG